MSTAEGEKADAASAFSPMPDGPEGEAVAEAARAGGPRRRTAWIAAGVCAAAVVAILVAVFVPRAELTASPPASTPTANATPTPTPTATPTPTPTPVPPPPAPVFPANPTAYDLGTLPQVNVFAVLPALSVDDDAFGVFTGEEALALGNGAPVFADPAGQPVGYLPQEYLHGGTTVPIVQKQENWVKVLLAGRQAVPSQGNPAQVAGWLRVQDIEVAPSSAVVEVGIAARTIDIVRAGVPERIATDFGWGTAGTPTPLGRSFIMTSAVVPEYAYTRGHPIVYLSVQSPTLDGFGGADVAVTAFHYHDQRSGAISNGCIRVDGDAITRLAELPLGTPVVIRP